MNQPRRVRYPSANCRRIRNILPGSQREEHLSILSRFLNARLDVFMAMMIHVVVF
jgi:hypothetical protein